MKSEWKKISIETDRRLIELEGKIRQSNWAVIIEREDGEIWLNKHHIRHITITEREQDDDD